VVRDRTTTSCAIIVAMALSALFGAPAPGDARADQVAVFPSDPILTIDVSESPVAAPVAAGDLLFVAVQSHVSARRLRNLDEVWIAKVVADGPLLATSDRLLVPAAGEIHGLEAATGRTIWTLKTSALSAPLSAHGDLFFVASAEQLTAYRLADGTEAWTKPVGVVEQRSAGHQNWLYVPAADGRIIALDIATGAKVWEAAEIGIKPTEPLVAGNRVFAGSEAKQLCSFDTARGRKEWCATVGAAVVGVAAVDKARVYCVALDNQLFAFDRNNGARRWKKDLRYRPSAGPTLIGESVTAPGKTNKLIAFDAAEGKKEVASLTFADELVAPPVFIAASESSPARVVTLSGGLNNQWKLTLAGPPPATLPSMKVVPLTALPGLVVPRAGALVPRE
jgi:outer membrane protein assembly factor BamB